ncbi:macro domain-containing protein [Pseudolysinimonas sp.]
MSNESVSALATHFADEARANGVDIPDGRFLAPRRLLADLLTVRDPSPVPADVQLELDALLQSEVAERGIVDARSLPTLAEQGLSDRPYASRVALWLGDLTILRADAIVNAANSAMLGCFVPGHVCIDNAIHAVAGPALRAECASHMKQQATPEPTGTATITSGYNLPARQVIHTVGPIVPSHKPSDEDRQQLRSSYLSILDLADQHALTTVGFCAISTGVFGYPKDAGALVALTTISEWLDEHPTSPVRPIVSAFTGRDLDIYRQAVPR